MLSKDEITARSLRLSGRPPNKYTGTLNDPFQEAQSAYAGPGWQQFFGGLQRDEEDANLAGKDFRVGWGGFGNGVSDGGGGSVPRRQSLAAMTAGDPDELNPLEQRAQKQFILQQQGNAASEQARAEKIALDEYNNAKADRVNEELGQSYNNFVLSSAFVPSNPITRTPAKVTVGPQIPGSGAGNPTYTAKPAAAVDTRQMMLNSVPGHMRPALEKTLSEMDLKRQAASLDAAKLQETARHNQATEAGAVDDVVQAVQGMKEGSIPPQLPGRASKDYTKIMAEAKRQGYDLARAATDWTATQKHIATMNGAQQLRLNQAINALPDMLDSVDALATKWQGGKFPMLNKANLALAKGGAFGPDAASIANQLDAQIADVTADLGNVYMGGNSPTDHALGLAGKSLKGEWDEKVLHDMVGLAKQNVTIRRNSINNTGVSGASADNPYGNQPTAAPTAQTVPTVDSAHAGKIAVQAPNGKTYYFDNAAQADGFRKRAGVR